MNRLYGHAFAICCIAFIPVALAETGTSGAQLKLSSALSHPRPIDPTERSLLRVEWKTARTADDELHAVDNMLGKIQRMEGTVREIRQLIAAIPAAAEDPVQPAPEVVPEDDFAWWALAGGTVVGLLMGWLFFRRRYASAAAPPLSVPPAISSELPAHNGATVLVPPSPFDEPETLQEGLFPSKSTRVRRRPIRSSTDATAQAPAVGAVVIQHDTAATPKPELEATPSASVAVAGDNASGSENADQALELADIMLSMGLAHGAAQTLEDHIRHHPRQALYHWLKLLDIYRRSGMEKQFDDSARDLRLHFNVHAFEWGQETSAVAATQSSIEDYPHISNRVEELWPASHCAEYLNRLLEDNRGGTRTGFPEPVAAEILQLLDVLAARDN